MKSLQGGVLAGRYRLSAYVAEGNFGAVFRSEQMFLGVPARRVAVKVSKRTGIPADKARELFADVFLLAQALDEMRDAVARSRLVHVYDAGIAEEGRGFVVMEYVEGATLARELEKMGRAGVEQTLRWARQIAEAIAALHELPTPLIHRDIKPDNILIGADRALRVVDFGLTARLNSFGWVAGAAGTTTYMAPETTRGKSIPGSDVYSIGLILYQALTGELPFGHLVPPLDLPTDRHTEWLTQQKERVLIAPPSRLNPTVPPRLDELVLRCLAFDPGRRVGNGRALLRALDELETPPELPPGQRELTEGRRLNQAGDLRAAAVVWRAALEFPGVPLPARVELLRHLALAGEALGEKNAAVRDWIELWHQVRESGAVMTTAGERVELLDRIIRLHREAGNLFGVKQYSQEKIRRFPHAA